MEIIHKLENSREQQGYTQKNYEKYSKHIRNLLRFFKKENKITTLPVECELFLAKSLSTNQNKLKRKYLKKLMELCSQFKENELGMSSYFKGMGYYLREEYNEAIGSFVQCRSFFVNYKLFLKEIDNLLDLCADKFQVVSLRPVKSKAYWNDIELQFETEEEKNEFFKFQRKEIKGKGFDVSLKNFILKTHFKKENLINLIKKDNTEKLRSIKEKAKQLFLTVKEFSFFLEKNYVSSEHVNSLYKESQGLFHFFKNLEERKNGNLQVEKDIYDFKTPESFKEVDNFFDKLKHTIEFDSKEVKKKFMDYLQKSITVEPSQINLPFLPVLYDLAYDFIEYEVNTKQQGGISKLISKFSSSFSLKK